MDSAKIICPKCGTELKIPDNLQTLFCMHCGFQIMINEELKNSTSNMSSVTENIVDNVRNSINSFSEHLRLPETAQKRLESNTVPEVKDSISQTTTTYKPNQKTKLFGFVSLAIAIVTLILIGTLFSHHNKAESDSALKAPKSASEVEGVNFKDIVTLFEKAGFTEVQTEQVNDLVIGLLKKEGDVKEVSINGDTSFAKNDEFPVNAQVIVRYHAFSKENPDASTEAQTSTQSSPEQTEESTPQPTDNKATPEETPTEPAQQDNLTVENNAELQALLSLKNPGDPSVAAFVEKYRGKNIEFDANICYMAPHGNYKHYFDFLICPGNYDPNSQSGPNFKIKRANVTHDLHITGDSPGYTKQGDNIRIVAQILEFEPSSELLYIKPVKTTYR